MRCVQIMFPTVWRTGSTRRPIAVVEGNYGKLFQDLVDDYYWSCSRAPCVFANTRTIGPVQATHSLCDPIRSSRYTMALGFSADGQRKSFEDDEGQLRSLREISTLRFQLDWVESISPDEGVLPARLSAPEGIRLERKVVPGWVVRRRVGSKPGRR